MNKFLLSFLVTVLMASLLTIPFTMAQELEWERTLGSSGDEEIYSIQQTADGGYIMTGVTNSFGAGCYDVYLVKTDAAGKLEWEKTFGGSNDDYGNAVQQTMDGGYIIVGQTLSLGAGGSDVYLIKTYATALWLGFRPSAVVV